MIPMASNASTARTEAESAMPSAKPSPFEPTRITDSALRHKFEVLLAKLADCGTAAVAYSGGVDSAFLAAATHYVLGPDRMRAFLAVSPSLAHRERVDAENLARWLELPLQIFEGTEFQNPAYLANAGDRCFHCKSDLYVHLQHFAREADLSALLYGGNLDDLGDYRPGQKAAEKHGARAPMAEAGLHKSEIRILSRLFGLPTHDKPAMPCLSSRIPYGSQVTPDKLLMVERGEDKLNALGFRDCRVRHEGDCARIEVPLEQLPLLVSPEVRISLVAALKEAGFRRVVVDLEGFRSGNLNEALAPASRMP